MKDILHPFHLFEKQIHIEISPVLPSLQIQIPTSHLYSLTTGQSASSLPSSPPYWRTSASMCRSRIWRTCNALQCFHVDDLDYDSGWSLLMLIFKIIVIVDLLGAVAGSPLLPAGLNNILNRDLVILIIKHQVCWWFTDSDKHNNNNKHNNNKHNNNNKHKTKYADDNTHSDELAGR